MTQLNILMTKLGMAILEPLSAIGMAGMLIVVSIIVGVGLAVVFRFTSNQKALKRAADQIRANLLAVKLFQHDLGVTLRCQGEMFKWIGKRLALSMPPMLVMIVPVAIVLSQLGLWYEHRPLRIGEAAVVEVKLRNDVPATLEPRINLQTPALRDVEKQAVYWRVVPLFDSGLWLTVNAGDEQANKWLPVAHNGLAPAPVRRPEPGVWNQLLHPGEAPLPADSAVREIIIHQPKRATPILGVDLPWWLTFLMVSCAAAYAVRSVVKVQF